MRKKIELDAGDIRLGEISGLHGVQGWVKVFSDTQPRENIFDYQPWQLYSIEKKFSVELLRWRKQGKTLVAKIKGIDDREKARELIGVTIAIDKASLPSLGATDFYWSQLIGLRVKTTFSASEQPLESLQDIGVVERLMETGANDVLVVRGDANSIDDAERLIPWVLDQFILKVDLEAREIRVSWDPEF